MTTMESSSQVLGQPEAPFTLDEDPGGHDHRLANDPPEGIPAPSVLKILPSTVRVHWT